MPADDQALAEMIARFDAAARLGLADTGLRTWGVPRIYAAAVALALTATSDPDGDVTAWRAAGGSRVCKTDLTTRDGLIAHLSALDGRSHFGDSLPGFVAAMREAGDETETFLVTHGQVLEDANFLRAVREHGPASAYAGVVARDGSFRLWHLSPAGRRLVRQAKLDLEPGVRPAVFSWP